MWGVMGISESISLTLLNATFLIFMLHLGVVTLYLESLALVNVFSCVDSSIN